MNKMLRARLWFPRMAKVLLNRAVKTDDEVEAACFIFCQEADNAVRHRPLKTDLPNVIDGPSIRVSPTAPEPSVAFIARDNILLVGVEVFEYPMLKKQTVEVVECGAS